MKISKNAVAGMLIIAFICLYATCKVRWAMPLLGAFGIGITCFSAIVIALTPKGK